jgi:phytoene desaturase (3,4-didehydrolycopene-forming)
MSSDLAVMKREIERWEGREGFERYTQWLGESGRHYELSVEHVLLRNFTGLVSMLRPSFLRWLFVLHPFESIYTRAAKYFWTERLRRVFTFGSMYMGMSPFDAPGTYSLLQYTELAEGIWYPVGGFWKVIEALVEVGRRIGVEYRMSCAVKEIILHEDGARAKGVRLESGEVLGTDVVVNNTDLVYAYSNLISPKPIDSKQPTTSSSSNSASYAKFLSKRPTSCSSISFYWALSRLVPELEPHNIFLAEAYRDSFDSIFKKHLIPDEPSFYVNVPSRIDPTAAPGGCDTIVVLVPVGHLIDEDEDGESGGQKPVKGRQDWDSMIALARKTILATIQQRTGVDLEPLIVHEETNSPPSWQEKFNLDRGAILGLSHSFFNVLSFRPTTRARRSNLAADGMFGSGLFGRIVQLLGDAVRGEQASSIKNLYMVGASAHPGTGVPICLAGGRLVAEQVCHDNGVGIPWEHHDVKAKWAPAKGRDESLDRVDRRLWLDSWQHWMVLALMLNLVPWVVLALGLWVHWVD